MKKYFLAIVCSLCLLICAACGQQEETPPDSSDIGNIDNEEITVGTVYDAAVVNIRIAPEGDSRIVDTESRGEMFKVVDYDAEEEWHKIICKGDIAYINSNYLYITQWPADYELTVGTVIGSGVMTVYAQPDTESKSILGTIKGEKFLVIDDYDENWYQIGFPTGSGYIKKSFLDTITTTVHKALQ